MRTRVICCIVLLLGAASPIFGEAAEPASLDTVLKELRAIREKQEELEIRITKIQKMLESKPGPVLEPEFSQFSRRGPDEEALSQIKVPENPTKDQVRKYVRDILIASGKQNSWSSIDPQVRMLADVCPGNTDVLLDELGRGEGSGSLYVLYAITAAAREEDKELILKALPQQRELAQVIVASVVSHK